MATERGLAGLAFADAGKERAALADMKSRWPKATYVEDMAMTAPLARRIFDSAQWRAEQPLRVVLIGTDFEVRVWEACCTFRWASSPPIPTSPARSRRQGRARGRRRRRQEPDLLRGAVPSRRRQIRRAHRLSLGADPQARHARLGSGPGRSGGVDPSLPSAQCEERAAVRATKPEFERSGLRRRSALLQLRSARETAHLPTCPAAGEELPLIDPRRDPQYPFAFIVKPKDSGQCSSDARLCW